MAMRAYDWLTMWLLKHRAFSSVNEVFVNKNFERWKRLRTLRLKGQLGSPGEGFGFGLAHFEVEREGRQDARATVSATAATA
jgi:hypothetical protein